ncbi:MAG: DUF3093 domain-containing protein [Salinibacterium sp.]|nr:DUF3093 domain-containing protein [Salinibacterium sp.]
MIHYRERLWPAPWLFISTALVIPASLLVFLPINGTVGVIVALVLYLGCVGLLMLGSPVLEITDTEFVAGKAHLPLALVGATEGFTTDAARLERGQRLDARAYLVIRGWIDPVLKVSVEDEADPAPYWLVSTRNPSSLAAALETATQRTRGK